MGYRCPHLDCSNHVFPHPKRDWSFRFIEHIRLVDGSVVAFLNPAEARVERLMYCEPRGCELLQAHFDTPLGSQCPDPSHSLSDSPYSKGDLLFSSRSPHRKPHALRSPDGVV